MNPSPSTHRVPVGRFPDEGLVRPAKSFGPDVGRRWLPTLGRVTAAGVGIAIVAWWVHDWIFLVSGGEFRNGEAIRPTDAGRLAFWVYRLLCGGLPAYAIIAASSAGVGYGLAVLLHRLVPGFFGDRQELARFQAAVDGLGRPDKGYRTLSEWAAEAGIRPGGYLATRLGDLDRSAAAATSDRESVHAANARMSTLDEAMVGLVLRPLVFLEWALPILGVLGTAWGISEAVDGLGQGLGHRFGESGIPEAGLGDSIRGLADWARAFDATILAWSA